MTEGVNLPGCFLAGFVERLEEAAPVVIAFENGFAAVATIEDVVDLSKQRRDQGSSSRLKPGISTV
jgi:hypothetical protein